MIRYGDFALCNVPPFDLRLDPKLAYLNLPIKVCPHFDFIKKCAQLAGPDCSVVSNEDRYCGHLIKKVDDMDSLSGRRGEDYIPDMACKRVFLELERQLMQIDSDLENFDRDKFLKAFIVEDDNAKIAEIIEKAHKQLQNSIYRHQLFNKWKTALGYSDRQNFSFVFETNDMIGSLKDIYEKNQCPLIPEEYFEGERS